MDPYLEGSDRWRDFHTVFCVELSRQLLDVLPEEYDARVEERAAIIESDEEEPEYFVADAAVIEIDGRSGGAKSSSNDAATATSTPTAVLGVPDLARPKKHVVIRLREGNRIVTVIELLSPANKTREGRQDMDQKREAVLQRFSNWIEIDLLTRGRRIGLSKRLPPGDYYATIIRCDQRWRAEVFAWGVLDCCPAIPVPLECDDDVPLDLAVVVDRVLENGRYARGLRYEGPPDVDVAADVKAQLERIAATPPKEHA